MCFIFLYIFTTFIIYPQKTLRVHYIHFNEISSQNTFFNTSFDVPKARKYILCYKFEVPNMLNHTLREYIVNGQTPPQKKKLSFFFFFGGGVCLKSK